MTQIYNHTTIINNFNYDSHNRTFINRGFEPQHIAEVTHTTIRPVEAGKRTANERSCASAGQSAGTHGDGESGAAGFRF